MTHIPMTPSQRKAVKQVLRHGVTNNFLDIDYGIRHAYRLAPADKRMIAKSRYEIKEITFNNEYEGFISMTVVIGSKTDEGTMAAILCRPRIHVLIGRGGGLTTYRTKKHGTGSTKVTGWLALNQGWES